MKYLKITNYKNRPLEVSDNRKFSNYYYSCGTYLKIYLVVVKVSEIRNAFVFDIFVFQTSVDIFNRVI